MTDDELRLARAETIGRFWQTQDAVREALRLGGGDTTIVVPRVSPWPAGYTGCGCTTPQPCWRHG